VSFARVYDRIMADVPYRRWLDYIESIWDSQRFSPETVLDLACGTGNLSILLAKRGYKVTGIDMSSHMLEVARQKCAAEGLEVRFIRADMRRFRLETPVDAAVCVFDSLNYLLEPCDVRSAFASVFAALEPGGLFVFDVNTPERLSTIPEDVTIFEAEDYTVIWKDLWDAENKWWEVRLTGFIKEKESGKWRKFDEVHRERAFPLQELRSWLEQAGFSVKAVYDSGTFDTVSPLTFRAYFVAEKPGEGQ